MDIGQIYEKVLLTKSYRGSANYVLFLNNELNAYYGTDKDLNCVFVLESNNPTIKPSIQSTQELNFIFNIKSDITVDGTVANKTVHILTCLSKDEYNIKAFIRLTQAFLINLGNDNTVAIKQLFTSLIGLFSQKKVCSEAELQGLYTELYTILYFYRHGIPINKFWHSEEKMKFDFSINTVKRIEVKSTLRELRLHHFSHEQLISDLYDIKIASFMLRKDDSGLSLTQLIELIVDIAYDDFKTLFNIEKTIKDVDPRIIDNIRYDENYLLSNIRFYSANNVPKFDLPQPQGVSNAEYNSDLTNTNSCILEDVVNWIIEG